MTTLNPIGIFDSGVGGLSVLHQIQQHLPHENLIYIADQANVPYGARSAKEIQQFSHAIVEFLGQQNVKMIVVACNTATAVSLSYLRQTFPHIPFVGMEPAVKPAAQQTHSGKVGVLATATTIQSERYAALMHRFAQNVIVYEDPCLGLVSAIESGNINTPSTVQLLHNIINPMLAKEVDTLVLGCTHYPFVAPIIADIVGTAVAIIDPAPAVARQSKQLLAQYSLLNITEQSPITRLLTTGIPKQLTPFVNNILRLDVVVETAVIKTTA